MSFEHDRNRGELGVCIDGGAECMDEGVYIVEGDGSVYARGYNKGGYAHVDIDVMAVLRWAWANRPDLIRAAQTEPMPKEKADG